MNERKPLFAIMKHAPETVGGWTHHRDAYTKGECKEYEDEDDFAIWPYSEYEEWHESEIMPYYR